MQVYFVFVLGTSDEHISLTRYLPNGITGAVVVCTPQLLAIQDVRRQITFLKKLNVPIIGVIENMSGFNCTACHRTTQIFKASHGGAVKMCEELNVLFLGAIPLDSRIGKNWFLSQQSLVISASLFWKLIRIVMLQWHIWRLFKRLNLLP